MSLLTRKQFVERFVSLFGAALIPSVIFDDGDSSSKGVLLIREIFDKTSAKFNHTDYYLSRKKFLDEQKFKELTTKMIANKEILDLSFQHNPSNVRIQIKFDSKKSYLKYCELTRSFADVQSFEATNYSINDKIMRV